MELRRAGGGRSGKRDLDERAAVTDEEEDERASQDGAWATLLLSCLLLGFDICKVHTNIVIT